MKKRLQPYLMQAVEGLIPLYILSTKVDEDTKKMAALASKSMFYSYQLRRSMRRLVPKFQAGETLTKKDLAALYTVLYSLPYFLVSSAIIAKHEVEAALAAAERKKETP